MNKTTPFLLLMGSFLITQPVAAETSNTTSKQVTPQVSQAATPFNCPQTLGWAEGLGRYLLPDAKMPVRFSTTASHCLSHQWSWETFTWGTANINGAPRFMSFPTPADLLMDSPKSNKGFLRLSSRSTAAHVKGSAITEGAGAIVQADGNMMVGPNGYPVYASVHMNNSYFTTAKRNLIKKGAYQTQGDDYFDVGAAVFKATWYRLDQGEQAPADAFITQAEVPELTVHATKTATKVVTTDKFKTVTVALVGLHVVGYVENHPEFLWATFEHKLNAPMIADNTFTPSATTSSPTNYTFYKAGTPFSEVNIAANSTKPISLSYDANSGKFSPVTNAVQQNKTGGASIPADIQMLNQAAQRFFSRKTPPQPLFGNYNLIGTVWMEPNTYVTTTPSWKSLGQANAVGSVNLSNSTAETFIQKSKSIGPTKPAKLKNCFLCHNATSYSFSKRFPTKLVDRRIATSHVLSEGTEYAVPNVVSIMPPLQQTKEATKE